MKNKPENVGMIAWEPVGFKVLTPERLPEKPFWLWFLETATDPTFVVLASVMAYVLFKG